MNEEKILSQIKKECSGLAPDSFDKIRRDISEESGSCRPDIIYRDSRSRLRFIKYTAAAAAVILPAVLISNINSGGTNSRNIYDADNSAVSLTSQQTVLRTDSVRESAAASAAFSGNETKAETGTNTSVQGRTVTEISCSSVPEYVSETVRPDVEKNSKPADSEEISEKSSVTVYSEIISEITSAAEDVTLPAAAEGLKSFKSDFKLVPGYSDKIYCLEFDADKISNLRTVYSGENHSYTVESPDAYTVYVYDIIVFDYDYFDFLSKGDFLFKSEKKYTLDEILSAEERLLTPEDLVLAGLAAEEH